MPNTAPEQAELIYVSVGVVRDADGRVLIAERRKGQHLAGLWEFPGGKVEAAETVLQALVRELREELGVEVLSASPMLRIRHDYPGKRIVLDVWEVTRFRNQARGAEGQAIAWVQPGQLHQYRFPEANSPIINALTLPKFAVVSGAYADQSDCLSRLAEALEGRKKLVYLRETPAAGAEALVRAAYDLCRQAESLLVVNDAQLARKVAGVGLHLKSAQLDGVTADDLSGVSVVGASAHSKEELCKCKSLKLSYAFLSPVFATQSHPQVSPLGVACFADLVFSAGMPVFALGGLQASDLGWVRASGAQGVASLSGFWPSDRP